MISLIRKYYFIGVLHIIKKKLYLSICTIHPIRMQCVHIIYPSDDQLRSMFSNVLNELLYIIPVVDPDNQPTDGSDDSQSYSESDNDSEEEWHLLQQEHTAHNPPNKRKQKRQFCEYCGNCRCYNECLGIY